MARVLLLALAFCVNVQAHDSRDMRLVGHHDLAGRGAYQPVIQRQGDRWIAYVGHHAPLPRDPWRWITGW